MSGDAFRRLRKYWAQLYRFRTNQDGSNLISHSFVPPLILVASKLTARRSMTVSLPSSTPTNSTAADNLGLVLARRH